MRTLSRRSFLRQAATVSAVALVPAPFAAAASPDTLPLRKLRFGVNYVPRRNWWYCWLDWDQHAIVDDLQVIASLGMDHIRIQCPALTSGGR
jgi:hypothetical protein